MTSAESVAARQWRPHLTERASPLDQPFVQSHDQDESSPARRAGAAQRTGVIDGADAALLIELMLAERTAITSRVGLSRSGRTRRCEWAASVPAEIAADH